ncbi:hypothetical protein OGW13_24635 [Citrobacter sp. Ca225]|uniref:hypothetical protein n=1 Tax=Citrobacter sp. Ca225 TaxID=2985002 RepID=UPI00257A8DDC|nr:hypothetical protein [Citrobacter sp. Ca225]MDM3523061.1 hypothetical protein [Citrobacter sp. Ca225]
MSSYGLMNVQREKERIDRLVYDIGFQYIHDLSIRTKYMIEERRFTSGCLDEYRYGKLDFGRAMDRLREYHNSLIKYHMNLRMGSVKLYVIAERERERHSTLTIALKQIGFVSGQCKQSVVLVYVKQALVLPVKVMGFL